MQPQVVGIALDADSKVGADAQVSPCQLVPPCRRGGHGTYISAEGGQHAAKPIGKYYFTEDALKHDLAALKRGAVYEKNEFYNRAKAWYKAEIDRLLHLEKVKEEICKSLRSEESNLETFYHYEPSPDKTPSKAPTRIQPPRAAKRKALEPPSPKRPRQQQTTKQKKTAPPIQIHPFPETKGDYTLAPYDWAQFRNHNQGEHRPSPWSYVQLQGLDVAYFVMRVEKAVREKIRELRTASSATTSTTTTAAAANTTDGAGEQQEQDETTSTTATTTTTTTATTATATTTTTTASAGTRQRETLRCVLASQGTGGCDKSVPPSPAPFEPAAALAPGEDWRPPAAVGGGSGYAGLADAADGITGDGTRGCSSWAADEVSRREERDRVVTSTRQHTPAPDAEMEISPTLGRWPASKSIMLMEDLAGHVVEVSGLRLGLDLCTCPRSSSEVDVVEEGVRFLML
ncbi:hypothetical protein MFIFM68171_06359 [Madurella fahalii]|uniref:Uncharacterized protein n=1 Tax=Madurella fahalii TaxID=1157608 RepID=A0ABQ0GEG3_9PEZI